MPRILTGAGILVVLLAPALAFAAYNDVTLTTDADLSVNSIELDVSGSSSSVIESIIVNPTNFSVTLLANSTFQITAPGRQVLAVDNSDNSSYVCNDSQSVMTYTAGHTMTAIITPSATLCATAAAAAPSGGGGSVTITTTSTTPTVTTPATPTTAATPAAPVTPAIAASGLSASQIQSILDVLASFDVDAATMASVKAALEGTPATGSVTSAAVHVFKADLTTNSLGSEVKALQQFLNAHGYAVAAKGAGSPGNETTKFGPATKAALIKYQKAKGITPAAGYFGAKTRAAVNAE